MKLQKWFTKVLAFVLAVSLAWVPMGKMENVKAETGTEVTIPDDGLRAYLYEKLGKSEENGDVITEGDLAGITYINFSWDHSHNGLNVADFTGLEYCTNLEYLDIASDVETLDFSFLGNLKKLITLKIDVPVIADLSALEYCTELTSLTFEAAIPDDMSAVSSLSKLTTLNLEYTDITSFPDCSAMSSLQTVNCNSCSSLTDISGLANCNNLTSINLENTAVSDITPLKGKTLITSLVLDKVKITDENEQGYMETISSLVNLENLWLNYCDIADEHISMLAPLTKLNTLIMGMNDVTKPDFLLKHKDTLEKVMLTSNPIADGGVLAQMKNLTVLGVGDTNITDFSFVSQLPNLTNGSIRFAEWNSNFATRTNSYEYITIKGADSFILQNDVKDANGNLIAPAESENYSYNEATAEITVPVALIDSSFACLDENIIYDIEMQTQGGQALIAKHYKGADVLWLKENPENLEIKQGESGTLSVTVVGTDLTFQWYKDGEPIEGATSAKLTLSRVTKGDEGSYTVEISSDFGGAIETPLVVTSDPAMVTVGVSITISSQPQNLTLIEGGSGSLSVKASGEGDLSYQWYKDDVALGGKTSSTLALSNVTASNAGTYKVEISDTEGNKVTSREATVTVQNALKITKQPTAITLKEGESGSLLVTAKGYGILSYQWYKGENAISGETAAILSLDNVTTADAGSYKVVVSDENSNNNGTVTSNVVNVTVQKALAITKQPISISVVEGKSGSLTVEAAGEGALTYQWYKGGEAVAGATAATLALNNVAMSDAGTYTVKVTDSTGSEVTSDAATVTVQNALEITKQPTGITLKEGESGTLSVTAEGHGALTYQWYKGEEEITGATEATLKLDNITARDAGSYKVVVSDENSAENGTVTSNVVTVVVQDVLVITKQPVSIAIVEGNAGSLTVEAAGEGALTYQWYKGSEAVAGATAATLTLNNVIMSDAGTYTVKVSDSTGSVVISDAATVTVQNALEITKQPTGITLKEGESGTLSVTAEGEGFLTYQWYKGDEEITGATEATLKLEKVTANEAGNYKVKVSDSNGFVISEVAAVKIQSPLVITKQPEGIALVEGESGSLTVKAEGEGALTYQWYKGKKAIKGATKASLTWKEITMSDAGKYKVEVTDSTGAVVTSDTVAVTVQNALEITKQPKGITLIEGEKGSLTVKAEGEGTLTYQWYKGFKAIKGATKATLTFDKVTLDDAGKYKVKISDSITGRTVTSQKVKIKVQKALKITKQPEGIKAKEGKKASLTVKAEGEGKLTYQWYKGEEAIEGATKATLKFAKLQPDDAGTYTVKISDKNGSIISKKAKVEVIADNKKVEIKDIIEETDTTLKITKQPVGLQLKQGTNGHLTVEASGGGILKYQWYKDGVAIAAEAGGTEAALKLNNATFSMAGTYKVVVSDDDESVTSEEVKITMDKAISKTNTTKNNEKVGKDNTSQAGIAAKGSVKEAEKTENADASKDKSVADKAETDKAENSKAEDNKAENGKAENTKAEDNKAENNKTEVKEEEVRLEDKNQENKTEAESMQTPAEENTPESNGNTVLIVIIIIALLAVAGVVVYLKKKQ